MLTMDQAICIRALDFSETSQIVTFFTRAAGKISAIAKGSKRPKSAFDGPVEIFSHGSIVFTATKGEKLAVLTEFEQQSDLADLAKNLFTLNCCLFAAELIDCLTDQGDPHPELFDSFLKFLQNSRVYEEKAHSLKLLILFQLTLLKEVGLMPNLNACVNCKTSFSAAWPMSWFSSSANGLVCSDCQDSFPDRIKLTKNAAGCLANLKMITKADEKTLNEIEKALISHFTETLGKRLKMAKYVLKG